MRLDLRSKCSFVQRLKFRVIERLLGFVLEPMVSMSYKRDFFGKHFVECEHEALLQMSHWSKGEAELFAAFVSKQNDCAFCLDVHTAVAVTTMDQPVVKATLDDWQTAPIPERLRATLGFLAKLNDTPDAVTPDDIVALEQQGLTQDAIAEAAYVCMVYNIIDRLADAFDYRAPEGKRLRRFGKFISAVGYRASSLPH